MSSPFLFISPGTLEPLYLSDTVLQLGRYCRDQGRPLVCLFPSWSGLGDVLPLLASPAAFVCALEERGLFPGDNGQVPGLNKSGLFGRIDKSIEGLRPEVIAIDQGCRGKNTEAADAWGRKIVAFIQSHYPESRILALDGQGNGRWIGRNGVGLKRFLPLDAVLPSGRAEGPLAVPKLSKAWQAAGPVLAVWPGICASGGQLARMLFALGPCPPDPEQSQAFLFMSGSGAQAIDPDRLVSLLGPWLDENKGKIAFGIQINICPAFDADQAERAIVRLKSQGLKLIFWTLDPSATDLPRSLLWQVSGWGLWNHINGPDLFANTEPDGPGAWIANNPNIVHSFNCLQSLAGASPRFRATLTAPTNLESYGRLPAPAGVPFWRLLGNAGNILAALCRMEAKSLLRLRARPDRQGAFALGQSLEFHYKKTLAD